MNNFFTTIPINLNIIILLTEQVLKQTKITYSNKEKVLYINKVDSIVGVDIIKNVEMVKMTPESMCNTFS